MAGFLSALGSMAGRAISGYLAHVQLVEGWRQRPAAQVRDAFAQYVRGHTPAGLAGFSASLSMLVKGSNNAELRAYAQSLLTHLRQPEAWVPPGSSLPAPELAMAVLPPEPAAPRPGSRQADVSDTPTAPATEAEVSQLFNRMDLWLTHPAASWPETIGNYLRSLSLDELGQFGVAATTIRERVQANMEAHERNRGNAWGHDFSDKAALFLATGGRPQADPDWQRRWQEFQQCQALNEAIKKAFAEDIAQRMVRLAQENHQAQQSAAAQAEARQQDRRRAADDLRVQAKALRADIPASVAAGLLQSARVPACELVLDRFEQLAGAYERGELSQADLVYRTQQQMKEFSRLASNPGPAGRRPDAQSPDPILRRAAWLDLQAGALKNDSMLECLGGVGPVTQEAFLGITTAMSRFQDTVGDSHEAHALQQAEVHLLRPAARQYQQLRQAAQPLLCTPLWEAAPASSDADVIFLAGREDLADMLTPLLAARGMRIAATPVGQGLGQARWNLLAASHVMVCDLRGAGGRPARPRAEAAYELGLALATGHAVVVVVNEDDTLPFDVDVEPLRLGADTALNQQRLGDALDSALYQAQRHGDVTLLSASLQALRQRVATHPKRAAWEHMGWLGDNLVQDRIAFAGACEQIARQWPQGRLQLLNPAWPGAYAQDDAPNCFHVMPFGPPWSNAARDTARRVCRDKGLHYGRGDEAADHRILHAIWQDICRAQVVLVDMTDGNLNVLTELGMAHALGRPTLMMQHAECSAPAPRHLEKLRTLRYGRDVSLSQLLHRRLPG